jgi:Ca2+-transporting ATPase
MVTGDHEVTARAVATDVGILDDAAEVMPGERLRGLSAAELAGEVERYRVFSRIDPLDKVKIVDAWQSRGAIVAMTGDGVNDAPALRSADIGVAMGSGTDVAREASAMVLADDNFATIVAAVREGRAIFDNLTRVVAYLLACNISEVLVMVAGFLVFGALGDPLLATQLLWINLVTDGLPALALGVDPPEGDVMARPPASRRDMLGRDRWIPLLLRGSFLAAACIAALVLGHYVLDREWSQVRTMVFTTLVLVQLATAYAMRARGERRNRVLAMSLLASVGLQALVVYTSVGARLFDTVALDFAAAAITVGIGAVVFALVATASRRA